MKNNLFLLIAICISQLVALKVSASDLNSSTTGKSTTFNTLFVAGRHNATDRNGNVYVTGFFNGPTVTFGTITLTNNTSGTPDMFIVKYDPSGNVLWAKSAGGSLNDMGLGIATDGSGNVYVTGGFLSSSITFGTITLINTNSGYNELFIVKYDSNGNVLWAKSAGGTDHDEGTAIATDGSGNVYVTGCFKSSSIIFGETNLINAASGTFDMFIVKYDSSGNVLWAKSAGGSSNDAGYAIATDSNGNVFVSGDFNSSSITFGNTSLVNHGSADIFIVKYNSDDGSVLWANSAGGSGSEEVPGIATDGSGNVYVTGYFGSASITFGNTPKLINKGSVNVFIVKYDASGNALWAKSIGGNGGKGYGFEYGYGIATNSNGYVFITGYFLSPSITFGTTPPLINSGSGDVFIVKYDASGNALWAKNAKGSSLDEGWSISTDISGNASVTGYFFSPTITFGSITLKNFTNATTYYDMFIAKYDANGNVPWAKTATVTTGAPKSANAGTNDPTASEITVYPNPTSGKVVLSTGSSVSAITSVVVYNMTGKEVLSRQSSVSSPQMEIDLSSQSKGIYIVLIKAGDNYYRRKIIVE